MTPHTPAGRRPRGRRLARLAPMLVLMLVPLAGRAGDAPEAKPRRPDLTEPVVCFNVRGFREFVPRDDMALTRDQKLEIYYEPFNYLILRDPDERLYSAHLVQDVHIRREGSERPVQTMPAAIDYTPRSKNPPSSLYLHTTVSLKELPPGRYEIDLILRDQLAEGTPETTHTLLFEVISPSSD